MARGAVFVLVVVHPRQAANHTAVSFCRTVVSEKVACVSLEPSAFESSPVAPSPPYVFDFSKEKVYSAVSARRSLDEP